MAYENEAVSVSGLVTAQIRADGESLRMWPRSDGRLFVAGKPGLPWTLHVVNNTAYPVEVIGSVDGRSIHRDEPGGIPSARGHRLGAYGWHEFKGWRLDDDDSGPFIFADPSQSVETRVTGSAVNAGVIGLLIYRQYRPEPVHPTAKGMATMDMAPVAVASAGGPESSSSFLRGLGTATGERTHDPVRRVNFERDGRAPDRLVIGYDTEANLRARAIIPSIEANAHRDPDPFPGERSNPTGYGSLTD
jgi:hypothetical protein